MILSVSRRTDIPSYFSEWFFRRLEEGFLYTRNPMNPSQISKINICPEVVDCIVFWTKNPEPMMGMLDKLRDYKFYFQFTLTGYGRDIECNIPHKKEKMIPVFQRLSEEIDAERVIWRYDPILFNGTYTEEYHLKAFEQIAESLKGYTKKCVISFIDEYAKNRKALARLKLREIENEHLLDFVAKLKKIAEENEMEIASCAESGELGIAHNACIDKGLIEQIVGYEIKVRKDRNQRLECGCVESIDVGTYNTCKNGCVYCYANQSPNSVHNNVRLYDVNSPILCSSVHTGDRVTERKIELLRR